MVTDSLSPTCVMWVESILVVTAGCNAGRINTQLATDSLSLTGAMWVESILVVIDSLSPTCVLCNVGRINARCHWQSFTDRCNVGRINTRIVTDNLSGAASSATEGRILRLNDRSKGNVSRDEVLSLTHPGVECRRSSLRSICHLCV